MCPMYVRMCLFFYCLKMSYHLADPSTASTVSSSDARLLFIRHHFSNLSLHNVPLLLLLLLSSFAFFSTFPCTNHNITTKQNARCVVFDAQLLSKSILSAAYNCKMYVWANNVEAGVERHRTKKKLNE